MSFLAAKTLAFPASPIERHECFNSGDEERFVSVAFRLKQRFIRNQSILHCLHADRDCRAQLTATIQVCQFLVFPRNLVRLQNSLARIFPT